MSEAVMTRGLTPAGGHASQTRDIRADIRTVKDVRALRLIAALSLIAEAVGAAAVLWRPSAR